MNKMGKKACSAGCQSWCLSVCGGDPHYKNKTVRPGAPGGRRGWDGTELKGDQDSENE